MHESEPQFLMVGEGALRRAIAYRHRSPTRAGAPTVLWLIGLKSDMGSTKATALDEWTHRNGIGCARFDYSGHGRSGGRFVDATVGQWIEEAEAVFTRVTRGEIIVAGSSTGAHVALMLLRNLLERNPEEARRIKGLVLVAPAWDVTELIWSELPTSARAEIMEKGVWVRPSPYDPIGFPFTRNFIEEGRKHLLAGRPFDPGRPVLVLQGLLDRDVPPEHARALKEILLGDRVRVTEVADGDHRLARDADIAKMFALIGGLAGPG